VGLGLVTFWLACTGASAPASGPDRPPVLLRALILSDGGQETSAVLKRFLADSGRFDVRVCESPDGLSGPTLAGFDVVVVDTPLAAGGDTAKAVSAFVASGKGLVIARGGLGNRGTLDGSPLTAGEESRQPVRFLDVRIARADHPIVRGLGPGFRTADSIPGGLEARPGAEVIATIDEGGRTVPVLAAGTHGRGRVVAVALGGNASALHEASFRTALARAGEWAASGAVNPSPAAGPDAIKALLITGGHDHEAAFYSLFAGDPEIGRLPVDTAANAFKGDLRGRYDVIIMYDFTRDLDETARRNLRDFVEGGKGIVVLHHALLNYQTWAWWSEDVVGGRYRLRREEGRPSSSVKDGQSIDATPVGVHPVLRGIDPFHITDEAYKDLAMSPRIRPLLTTDNPTSNTNLAWIGPCETSRVVAIQLGHGPSAFGHPSYRALVHNAILWAAGRTP
jgi:type 1 glutamine amidotransferase